VASKSSEKANLCYTVKKGDSLSKIAQRYQTTEANLMAMNNMSGSKQVNKGQVLLVTSRSRAGESSSVSPKQSSAKSRQASGQEAEPLEASMFPNWQKKSKPTATAKTSKQAKGQSSSTSKKKGRSSESKKKNTASQEKKGKEVSQYNVKPKKAKMLAGSKRKKVSCCILRIDQKSISKMTA
jgi:LysM repeat protein